MADDKGLGIKSWLSGPKRRDAKIESSDPIVLDKHRVAVLPFTNLSSNPEDGYFADGMTEELITSLSGVRQLTVIARTSVMKYKGSQKGAADVGRELNAGTLIEGSVRKAGNKVRITAQLIDTESEGHVWARNYDRQLEDVFAIQSEIAEMVSGELRIRLLDSEKRVIEKVPTGNTEAYSLFLQGRELVREETGPSLRSAVGLLEEAVKIDPSFAKAHSMLAECLIKSANSGYLPFEQASARAKQSVKKALELDPELAEPHSVLAYIHFLEDRIREAESEAKHATELNPSLPESYRELANIATVKGQGEESLRFWEAAYRLDPVRPRYIERLGAMYFYLGRETEALRFWERTESIAPAGTYRNLTEYYLSKGEDEKAKEYFSKAQRLDPRDRWTIWMTGFIAARTRDKDTAMNTIREIENNKEVPRDANDIAQIYYELGDLDSYFAYLNKALDQQALYVIYVMYSPLFARARKDPRYSTIMSRVKRLYEESIRRN